LAALAQSTWLKTFRLRVEREPAAAPAGEMARLMEVPRNTMSSHPAILARTQLIVGDRQCRSISYRANLDRLRGLSVEPFVSEPSVEALDEAVPSWATWVSITPSIGTMWRTTIPRRRRSLFHQRRSFGLEAAARLRE
jgi:hypothetical protein